MSQRSELYKKFGPLLIEAIVKITIDDLNRIRANAGMPQITPAQFMTQIEAELAGTEPYDWMDYQ